MTLAGSIRASLARRVDTVRTAPGRVNLIGEHTDYSLLPVLPMAIDRTVVVRATARSEPGIRLDSERFPDPIALSGQETMSGLSGWHRYAAAVQTTLGLSELGADVVIGGDLPAEGGLSSSSALTVALCAALLELAGASSEPDEVVAASASAERLTGVAGGDMDQNVIVRGVEGHALRIDFAPFATRNVPVPTGVAIVAAHSGTVARKGGNARVLYNDSVLGCRVAAVMLASELGIDLERPWGLWQVANAPGVSEAVQLLPETMEFDQIETLGFDAADLELQPSREAPLTVRRCAKHVLSEAARVDLAEHALTAGDVPTLGALFDSSQSSLEAFGASTPQLTDLTAAMRQAGAAGARLTGAGFGGYAIAVCRPEDVRRVSEAAIAATGGPAFRVQPSRGLQ